MDALIARQRAQLTQLPASYAAAGWRLHAVPSSPAQDAGTAAAHGRQSATPAAPSQARSGSAAARYPQPKLLRRAKAAPHPGAPPPPQPQLGWVQPPASCDSGDVALEPLELWGAHDGGGALLPFSSSDDPAPRAAGAAGAAGIGTQKPAASAADVPKHLLAQQAVQQLLEAAAPEDAPGLAAGIAGAGLRHVTAALGLLAGMQAPPGRAGDARRAAAGQLGAALVGALRGSTLEGEPPGALAALCSSMGRLGLYDVQVMARLEARSLELMQQGACTPSQLGQLSRGLVLLDHQPSLAWLQAWVAATSAAWATATAPQLPSIAAAGVAWLCGGDGAGTTQAAPPSAAAAAGAPMASAAGPTLPAPWVGAFAAAVAGQLPACSCAMLAGLMRSAAAMHAAARQQGAAASAPAPAFDGAWLAAVVRRAQQVLPDARPDQLAAMLQALAVLTAAPPLWPPPPPAGPEVAPGHGTPAAGGSGMPEACRAAGDLPRLLDGAARQLQVLLPLCGGADLVTCLAALLRLGWRPWPGPGGDAWSDAVLLRLLPGLPRLGAGALADLGAALGVLRRRPHRQWTTTFAAQLRLEAADMVVDGAVGCLAGLAAVGVKLDPQTLHAFVGLLRGRLGEMGAAQLAAAAAAVRGMYGRGRPLPGRTVHLLVQEMERRARYQA